MRIGIYISTHLSGRRQWVSSATILNVCVCVYIIFSYFYVLCCLIGMFCLGFVCLWYHSKNSMASDRFSNNNNTDFVHLRLFAKQALDCVSVFFAMLHFAWKGIWTLWIASIVWCVATSSITLIFNTKNVSIHGIYHIECAIASHTLAQTSFIYVRKHERHSHQQDNFWEAWMDGIMLNTHAHNVFRCRSISVSLSLSLALMLFVYKSKLMQRLTHWAIHAYRTATD